MRKIFKKTFIWFALASLPLATEAQYFGGIGNGFGGIATINLSLSLVDSVYNGGISNGFFSTTSPFANLSLVDSLYNGGDGIGYFANTSNIDLALQDSLYNGGAGKGDNLLISVIIRLNNCNDNQLVWNGNTSVFWNNPANWDCGSVPINTSKVTIPADAARIPLIAASAIASKVTVLPNANINLIGGASHLTLTGQ